MNQIPDALAWFERLNQRNEVLRILREDDERMTELWGFGRNPSPICSYLAGYVAMSLGERELAKAKYHDAVLSKCFVDLFTSVDGAIHRAV
jgi:hypothetical protein